MKKNVIGRMITLTAVIAVAGVALAGTCTSEPITITGAGNLIDTVIEKFSSFAAGFLLLFK